MNQQLLEQLLGRPLTSNQQTNLSLYFEIAKERLEQLLCMSIEVALDAEESPGESPAESPGEVYPILESRTYSVRKGYRTLFVDPFISITEVKFDGEVVEAEDYRPMLNNRYNSDWYNSVVFDERMTCQEVEVTAYWGFESLPPTLALLMARLFDVVSVEQGQKNNVKRKSIEGFSVEYSGNAGYDQFVLDNSSLINQYRQCDVGEIDHGRIRPFRY